MSGLEEQVSLGEGYLKRPFAVRERHLDLPTGPGLGIELDEEALADRSATTGGTRSPTTRMTGRWSIGEVAALEAIVETAIDLGDLEATEALYREVLGLESSARRRAATSTSGWVGMSCWPSTLRPRCRVTCCRRTRPGHFALGVRAAYQDESRRRLEGHGG